MSDREYRFKFYLNARHAVNIQDQNVNIHPHTWEIVLHVRNSNEGFISFAAIEAEINGYLEKYQGQYLNAILPFDTVLPLMENIGETLYQEIFRILDGHAWELFCLEISENPTRTYIITGDAGEIQWDGRPGEMHFSQMAEKELEAVVREAAVTLDVQPAPELLPKRRVNRFLADNRIYVLTGLLLTGLLVIPLLAFLMGRGMFPWGSDSWYHLFKGDLLYKSISKGDFFPLFNDLWYNGVQPLRYWAPLPHYVLAAFEFVTGGSVHWAYNLFIGLVFVLGALGWILWGLKTGRKVLGLGLALLWFFLPDNLRVLFSEGNLSRVAVTTLFPYLLLNIWLYYETGKRRYLGFIVLLTGLVTFCHAMIAAMTGITVFLFVLWYGIVSRKLTASIHILLGTAFGIMLAGLWLYPALKGGILSMDAGAVGELMKGMTYPALDTLNPFHRFADSDSFYFGTSLLLIACMGLWLGGRKSRAGFGVALIIFLGTTRELLPLVSKVPASQLFWMMRFTPLAMGTIFVGLLLWKKIRTPVLGVFILLILADAAASFHLLGHNAQVPREVTKALDLAAEMTTQRVALLDESSLGSYPSFYLSNTDQGQQVAQVFGSGWQGAKTTPNIVDLNTALEKGYYPFLLDRCLEQGADTVVVLNSKVKHPAILAEAATRLGFEMKADTGLCAIYKHPVEGTFGSIVKYDGLGIGKYARNLAFLFPAMETGASEYIDQYPEEKLLQYKTLFLSGFNYKNKAKAEQLIRSVSQKGVRVLIDLTGAPNDMYTSRPSFLKVVAQPVEFRDRYPGLTLEGRLEGFGPMPEDSRVWRTYYLQNLDNGFGKMDFRNQEMDVLGTKGNQNILFVGLNLSYFSMETRDKTAIGILEKLTGLAAGQTPQRTLVPVDIRYNRDKICLYTGNPGVVTGLANLDSFRPVRGGYEQENNLVRMKEDQLVLQVFYPYFKEGAAVSLMGLLGMGCLLMPWGRWGRR